MLIKSTSDGGPFSCHSQTSLIDMDTVFLFPNLIIYFLLSDSFSREWFFSSSTVCMLVYCTMFNQHSNSPLKHSSWSSNLTSSIKKDSSWKACVPFPCRHAFNINDAICKHIKDTTPILVKKSSEPLPVVNNRTMSQSILSLTSHPLVHDKETRNRCKSAQNQLSDLRKQKIPHSFNDLFKLNFSSNPYSSASKSHRNDVPVVCRSLSAKLNFFLNNVQG